ncbi:hypothetical protein J5N97_021408 [Dioscorea zingiberensis]|uniref:Uncharacterized protein n=1 Tax=Dioscorea zingiberensis TaxID=325984 RepID=A0A9D5CIA2_9LILI|nr:hypothetical protein J5N97_021408 [Dioscorea zingiberensis]
MAAVLAAVRLPLVPTKLPPAGYSNLRCCFSLRSGSPRRSPRARVVAFADGNGRGEDGGEDLKKGEQQRPVFKLRWRDLLDPDPDNILAVGLTGVLAWASVQVLWQLFFISLAILLAALKYSFIAALLLFILITLL